MAQVPSIDTSNINEKVYDFLKQGITDFTYPPGHKFDLRELRRQIGISQTPIKDALFRLSGEGLVEISSRRGTFVKEVTKKDIGEIYDARMILEGGAGEMVARTITDEQLDELEMLFRKTLEKGANSDYKIFMEREREFHLAIIRFADNKKLLSIYKELNAHMQAVRFRFGPTAKRLPHTNKEHERILKAMRSRDPDKVKAAIMKHLASGKTAFLGKAGQKQSEIKRKTRRARKIP
jgi:DNA-binding GntR family transcriptional regulator